MHHRHQCGDDAEGHGQPCGGVSHGAAVQRHHRAIGVRRLAPLPFRALLLPLVQVLGSVRRGGQDRNFRVDVAGLEKGACRRGVREHY